MAEKWWWQINKATGKAYGPITDAARLTFMSTPSTDKPFRYEPAEAPAQLKRAVTPVGVKTAEKKETTVIKRTRKRRVKDSDNDNTK